MTVPAPFVSVRVRRDRVPLVSNAVASSDLVEVTVLVPPCSLITTYTVPIMVGVISWVLS